MVKGFYFVKYRRKQPVDAMKTDRRLVSMLRAWGRGFTLVEQWEYVVAKLALIEAKYRE